MQYLRLNLIIAAWACLILGGTLVVSDVAIMGYTVVSGGTALLILAMAVPNEVLEMSDEQIAAWSSPGGEMPDAGRPMYRIDTTLDEPIRTSILCGRCGTRSEVDDRKPVSWACPACGTELWDGEEE